MKWTRGRAKAEVHLRAQNAGFCRPCYRTYFRRQVERAIAAGRMCTPAERVVVAVSGGKDSLALWDVLVELDYRTTGLYLAQGIGAYSDRSREKVEAFASARALSLRVVDLAAEGPGLAIPDVAGLTRRSACSACAMLKRHFFHEAALAGEFDVLATGPTDDEALATRCAGRSIIRRQRSVLRRRIPASAQGEAAASAERVRDRGVRLHAVSTTPRSARTAWARRSGPGDASRSKSNAAFVRELNHRRQHGWRAMTSDHPDLRPPDAVGRRCVAAVGRSRPRARRHRPAAERTIGVEAVTQYAARRDPVVLLGRKAAPISALSSAGVA